MVREYDINGNQLVNATDRTLAIRGHNGIDPGADIAAMDVNGNGEVGAADGSIIIRAANGIDPCL